MSTVSLKLGDKMLELHLPDQTDILSMRKPQSLPDPKSAILDALEDSAFGSTLGALITERLRKNSRIKAVVVISDNTRPVPYRGEQGILWPIIEQLLSRGIFASDILILVATGTHRPVTRAELEQMLDPRVFELGIAIKNHDCDDRDNLVHLGKTSRGSEILINKDYVEADLKIVTGLVESHFMAGVSGGRKSVCPGLVGRASTYVFHGAPFLTSPLAGDLVLVGNPCHEEALEVARWAGVDYLVNVTLDGEFRLTGVFAGDLELAHAGAVEQIKQYVAVPLRQEYDIVVTHAGFVGLNHYQAAKAGVGAIPALKQDGRLIILANTADQDHVGSSNYRVCLHLLRLIGPQAFLRLLLSPDWTFLPDQWQVQMWAKVLQKTAWQNIIYFSPPLGAADYRILPSVDGNVYLPEARRYRNNIADVTQVAEAAIAETVNEIRATEKRAAQIAYLADGPYGILTAE